MYCWLIKEKKWFCENRIYICALSVITAVFSLLYFNRFAARHNGVAIIQCYINGKW